MFGMFFLGALYMQRMLGYNPLEVGLAFLPTTLVMGTMSLRFSARLNMRFGPSRHWCRAWPHRRGAAAVRADAGGRDLRGGHRCPSMVMLGAGVASPSRR